MKNFITLILLLSSSIVKAQAVSLQGVIAGGSGCPEGSVTAQISPDGSALTVLYDRFDLRAGADLVSGVQDCEIRLRIKKPLLMGFRIESADFRGFVHLDPGVIADQNVRISSGPTPELRRVSAEFASQQWIGPISQNYTLTTVRPLRTPEVLDCVPPRENTQIVIQSRLRIAQAGGSRIGQLTVDSVDGKLVQRYNIKWVNCLRSARDFIRGLGGGR